MVGTDSSPVQCGFAICLYLYTWSFQYKYLINFVRNIYLPADQKNILIKILNKNKIFCSIKNCLNRYGPNPNLKNTWQQSHNSSLVIVYPWNVTKLLVNVGILWYLGNSKSSHWLWIYKGSEFRFWLIWWSPFEWPSWYQGT